MAPLQKRTLLGFMITVPMSIALVAIFIIEGATKFNDDMGMRLLVYGVFIGGMLMYALLLLVTRWRRNKTQAFYDERDLSIARRAERFQLIAVLISLGIWAIALNEFYWEEGHIPLVFPYLIFMSSLIINIMAQSVGILLGYWREDSNGRSG